MFILSFPLSPEFYLDPGSGSMLFQMIVAAFLGAGIIIRTQWSRIKRWFGKGTENEETDDRNEDNQ